MISTRQKLTRYSGSLLLVLAVHAIAIIIAVRWPASQAIELPPAAMMVELAPLPEPAPPPPPKVVQPPPPPAPEEPEPMPEVAQAPKPEIVVPKKVEKPKPKPKPQPPKPQKKPEPPQEKPADEKPVDTPPTTAKPEKAAAPKPAPAPAPPSNALPSWQGDLLSHLGKYKKYPEDARRRGMQGVARLRFVVDADGNVLSYSIANSSGSPALDRATMEMIRRAQPLPKPPKEILNNGTIEILAPFVYSLDKR
ncbi:energy transducer TonB [Pseudomonas amygdali pv. tabaci str. ATCC 11528]|uniref:energy transducer TonB n=1 Tax=Pseudomonas syringae group genomosp. 2 TaxID=251698 RepID=UPI0001BC97FB|nr:MULTISPECIES: energy transducer TonB [Pseudomonas syringae group genomosp. 2]KEZ71102.1 energy transducer TonB [Pseudomonas amygdali pv. tabaci str. ATCC 11528]KKY53428.1 energy transducer TonB [Pseudomonas amygdali pv. tabaci str. ATCC 11528]QED82343.1 energy transducer TonB [Pseudomonas amygdali pv. tabaci str. ATCC 11528]QOI02610.1 energy transducer TonB [Pseudomonas savastanoi]